MFTIQAHRLPPKLSDAEAHRLRLATLTGPQVKLIGPACKTHRPRLMTQAHVVSLEAQAHVVISYKSTALAHWVKLSRF